jgi:dephospho-CoA kinase
MIEFKEFLAEGVYDRSVFKAFFLAGGPGSGKSWVSTRTLGGAGMKVINSDSAFESLLKRERMSLDFKGYSESELVRRDEIRAKAKRMTAASLSAAIEGRLGLILDSTARDVARIESERAHMEAIGYDTFMIFVNTSREVALVRNQERKRKLPDAIVIQNHKQVQANIGKLQNMFGNNNFAIIDNNKVKEDVNPKVYKAVRKLVNRDPTSKVAKDWVKRELARKSGKAGFWSRFKSKYL